MIKNFVVPEELEFRLRRMGWDGVIRRDSSRWVYMFVINSTRPPPASNPRSNCQNRPNRLTGTGESHAEKRSRRTG